MGADFARAALAAVSLIGPMNITRAVLPVMRKQRAGQIISISSSAGLAAGFDFVSAHAASKFGLEAGWSRCTPRSRHSASPPPSSTRVLPHGAPDGVVWRGSPLFSDFAGVMSLEMSLAASVFRSSARRRISQNSSFQALRRYSSAIA